jgi:hypothetical protein
MVRLLGVVLLALLAAVTAELTILKAVQVIYDRSPKLRLRGTGFDPVGDLLLELGSAGGSNLSQGTDFYITNATDTGITLRLIDEKVWVNLEDRNPPVALVLRKVAFKTAPTINLLPNGEAINIANVLESPSVFPSNQVVFASVTHELRINGTGFTGAKDVDIYFDPPLLKEIDYSVVSNFPIAKDEVVLQLQHKGVWRADAGPLVVVALDTGGGPVAVGKVTVAQVVADLDSHDISVTDTSSAQFIYHDEPSLVIKGSGFNPAGGNKLSFSNAILGRGVNYTVDHSSATELHLTLTPGQFWRRNGENLPGYLTVLAVDSNLGGGFVSVGPINAGKGKDVATVFERPQVFSNSSLKIFRTHSHSLTIRGTGFPLVLTHPELQFDPPLPASAYYIEVVSRTEMVVTLEGTDGTDNASGWRPDAGPLRVTKINTLGLPSGWVDLTAQGGGVLVAAVQADVGKDRTGGVEVFAYAKMVYQSFLSESVDVHGTGFHVGMAFEFDSPLQAGADYELLVSDTNTATLRLQPGRKWRADAGFLTVKAVVVGGQSYSLAEGQGVRVAVVLLDPAVTASAGDARLHESQSKVILIKGSGFTSIEDTTVVLQPTAPESYKVVGVLPDTIRLQLLPGKKWLPDYLSLGEGDGDKSIALQVVSLDCGAGAVVFGKPVTIGLATRDRAGETCDDSCDFAFDGVCDDGSQDSDDAKSGGGGGGGNYYLDDDGSKLSDAADDQFADYYTTDDTYKISGCLRGTDCTDCGGIDAVVDYTGATDDKTPTVACDNSCAYSRDGVCDDPRANNYCVLGTDCQDCGPVGASNFTSTDDDAVWEDDDDYWNANDNVFMEQTQGLDYHRAKSANVVEEIVPVQPGEYVGAVLLGVAYTVVLAVVALVVLFCGFKVVGYDPYPALRSLCNLGDGHSDIELGTTQRMEISPFRSDRSGAADR